MIFKKSKFIPVNFEVNIYKNEFLPYDIRNLFIEGINRESLVVPGLPQEIWPIIIAYLGHTKKSQPITVNFKYYRHIYLASLNDKYALEMVMYLHQYVHESINQVNITPDRTIGCKEEIKEFKSSQLYVDLTLKDRAYRDSKMDLLNYIISMHEQTDHFVKKFPLIHQDEGTFFALKKLYQEQKKLFQLKAYPELFNLLKNCKLVFSARSLVRDQSFVAYCKSQNNSFVNLYINNAIHKMQYQCENDLYDGFIESQLEEKEKNNRNNYFTTSVSIFAGLSVVAVGLYSVMTRDDSNLNTILSLK